MGCYKLTYYHKEETEPFLGFWKNEGLEENRRELKNRDSYYPGGATISALSSSAPLSKPNQFKYQGKELQTDFDFNTYDFHARMYDPLLVRTFQPNPMADQFFDHSPYSWVKNNPIGRIDPSGMTDFTFDKKTGEITQVGEVNDEPDRILKTNRKGEIKYKKNGEARVALGDIKQGILKDGQNFKTDDQTIDVDLLCYSCSDDLIKRLIDCCLTFGIA